MILVLTAQPLDRQSWRNYSFSSFTQTVSIQSVVTSSVGCKLRHFEEWSSCSFPNFLKNAQWKSLCVNPIAWSNSCKCQRWISLIADWISQLWLCKCHVSTVSETVAWSFDWYLLTASCCSFLVDLIILYRINDHNLFCTNKTNEAAMIDQDVLPS